jgi:nucleotide-binding universal stress UspA family protein
MEKIIVGVDGSEGATSALRWAVAEADLRGATVEAVMAWGLLNQHHVPFTRDRFDPQYDRDAAADALRWYVDEAVGADRVDRRVVNDLPARALQDTAEREDAHLLVVGGRHLGQVRAGLLGSVTYECLHTLRRPIAVVRPGMAHHTERARVVVGVDGSANARRALEWAVEAAVLRGAALEVVHSWHVPYMGPGMYGPMISVDPNEFEQIGQDCLREVVASVDVSKLGEPPTLTLVNGGAAGSLLEASRDADLVVVGSRGLGGFAGLVLGSTSSQVVHHAPCPVVVVPGTEG